MEESSQPGAWAVFLSQIFEHEGSVAGILDTLKDGPPKLQQAYLNIINLIFSNNSSIEDDPPCSINLSMQGRAPSGRDKLCRIE